MPKTNDVQAFSKLAGALDAMLRERNLSQTEVARRAGLSLSVVNRALLGSTVPSIETLDALLVAMGAGVRDLAEALERVQGPAAESRDAPARGQASAIEALAARLTEVLSRLYAAQTENEELRRRLLGNAGSDTRRPRS